ncbi:Aquaporin Z [Streptomyces collinus]|nr:Aquaporin Z [Streptomyces collinus]UJA12662.1 Aquaporin Z [Streptomyces collinus]
MTNEAPPRRPGATTAGALARRAAAEAVGTGLLVAVAAGSAIQATRLSQDAGVRLLACSLAGALGLGVLVTLFGPVSGGHLNPAVTLSAWYAGRRRGAGPTPREVAAYLPAQTAGALGGAVLADAMFARPLLRLSTHERSGGHLWLGEAVATAGLVLLVVGLERAGRARALPAAAAAYTAAACWFTSSTAFANPAATIGRALTDTAAGIAPGSVLPFVAAQLLGTAVGLGTATVLFGRRAPEGDGGAGPARGPCGPGAVPPRPVRRDPAQPSLNFCAADPLQSQICSRVPLAVAPPGESRHRPDCGFSSEPSACCTHF